MKAQCPQAPPVKCHLCGGEHKGSQCTEKRTDKFKDAPVKTETEAWNEMEAATDLEVFKVVSQPGYNA